MLDSLLNNNGVADTLSFSGTLIIIGAALLLGLFISLTYIHTHKKEDYAASFTVTLIILPAIIAMIILLVGSNVARAFSLAGAFSLIRFRSAPGDAKDITYVFFTLGVGLACGMGYIGYAMLFAVSLIMAMMLLDKLNFGGRPQSSMRLKITLPEDIDYHDLFETILQQYTAMHQLTTVKTAEFGSLFELTYEVKLRDPSLTKEFLDCLRCKNGNLSIALSLKPAARAKD